MPFLAAVSSRKPSLFFQGKGRYNGAKAVRLSEMNEQEETSVQERCSWRTVLPILLAFTAAIGMITCWNRDFSNVFAEVAIAHLFHAVNSANGGSKDNDFQRSLVAGIESRRSMCNSEPTPGEKWWYQRLLSPDDFKVVESAWQQK